MFKYLILISSPIFFLFAQEDQLPDSCFGEIIFSNQLLYSNEIILEISAYQNSCNVHWDYYTINIVDAKTNDLIQIINGYFDTTFTQYEENNLKDYFVSFEDLNFDKINDLLIYEDKIPWQGNSYKIWVFDTLQNKFVYNKTLNSILGGGNWEIDTSNKILEYSYDNGCSECWANDKYQFKDNDYILIERTSSYDGLRLGYQNYELVDGIFTLLPPYVARWGYPFPDFSFDTCVTLKKTNVYFYPDDEIKIKYTLEMDDTIVCKSGDLIFSEFGEVLITEEMKLKEIESYPPNYDTFVSGDTLFIYFVEDGNYEFTHKGKYYVGKPFWSNEKILVNDAQIKSSGILIKDPEIIWWIRIDDKKNREGYIKLINDDISYLRFQERLKILK